MKGAHVEVVNTLELLFVGTENVVVVTAPVSLLVTDVLEGQLVAVVFQRLVLVVVVRVVLIVVTVVVVVGGISSPGSRVSLY